MDFFLGFFSDLAKTYSRLERGVFFPKGKIHGEILWKIPGIINKYSLISDVSVSPCFCFVSGEFVKCRKHNVEGEKLRPQKLY